MRLGPAVLLTCLLVTSVASADRAPVAPPTATPQVRRRVVPRPPRVRPVPARPTGRPPVSAVRTALRNMGGDVQRCAETHEPWPGAGARPRLRLRVWLEPAGNFTLEVPELEGRTQRDLTPRVRINLVRLFGCLNAQVARNVARLLHPFRGRRQKIERAFRIHTPGPPPSERELARLVTARRTELLGCVPGAGATGEPEELVIRATLGTSGLVELTGLAVPSTVRFDLAARCVADAIGGVHTGRVTSPRSFEAVLRYRFTAGAVSPPE